MDNRIIITNGTDIENMTYSLLNEIDVCALIGDNKNAKIALKPNIVVAKPSALGATTSIEIVEAIIKYLQNYGYKNISVIESAWVGDNTKKGFEVCGYNKVSKKYGVELFDVKDDEYRIYDIDGMRIEMSEKILEQDFLINIPVLKGHCQTHLTCALKNMKGCISDKSKRYFHTIGLHRPIAALNSIRKADLVVVDGINGDLDYEEGGTPVYAGRMLAGTDSVLIDAYCATLIGYEPTDIKYIPIAEELKVGSADIKSATIKELVKSDVNLSDQSTRRALKLKKYTSQDSACSACYAALIYALAKLEDKGELSRLKETVYIGQGYKGKKAEGMGVGNCCGGFTSNVLGCPPKALDIVRFFRGI